MEGKKVKKLMQGLMNFLNLMNFFKKLKKFSSLENLWDNFSFFHSEFFKFFFKIDEGKFFNDDFVKPKMAHRLPSHETYCSFKSSSRKFIFIKQASRSSYLYTQSDTRTHTSATNIKICYGSRIANEMVQILLFPRHVLLGWFLLIYTAIKNILQFLFCENAKELWGWQIWVWIKHEWYNLFNCHVGYTVSEVVTRKKKFSVGEFANIVANFHLNFTCDNADVILLTAMTWRRFGETWTCGIEWMIGWARRGWSICH